MSSLFVFLRVRHVPIDIAETFSDFLPEGLPGVLGLQVLLSGVLKVSEIVDDEASGHHVGLIDVLDKGFDASFFDEFLLVESTFGSKQVTSDACDQEVRESQSLL